MDNSTIAWTGIFTAAYSDTNKSDNMSNSVRGKAKRITTHILQEMKEAGEKIAMLTGYDYSMARILDDAGIDIILVGDSASNVMAGHETTLPITLDQMIYHASSVVRAVSKSLVVVDLPFGSYQGNSKLALESAVRIMKESGAHAVKMEGGVEISESITRILSAGVPVMGHLGVLPQSVNQQSGYRERGRDSREAEMIATDALALQDAGAFAVVLEAVPAALAARITSSLQIPTVGIGAGPDCDGQVLVSSDLLGLHDRVPPFAKKYVNLAEVIVDAARAFVADVQGERARTD